MKIYRIIIVITLFIIGVYMGLLLSRRAGTVPQKQPPIASAPPVAHPSPISTAPVTYSVPVAPAFPDAVQSLNTQIKLSPAAFAETLAHKLSFSVPPTSITGTRGNFLLWSEGDRTLTYVSDTGNVVYVSGAGPGGVVSETNDRVAAFAETYLAPLISEFSSAKIVPTNVIYFAPTNRAAGPTTDRSAATVLQINFRYEFGGMPVYTRKFGSTADVWIQLGNTNEVLSFSITPIPDLAAGGQRWGVVSSAEAIHSLVAKQGVLSSLGWSVPGEEPQYLSAPPDNISVDSMELAYYYDASSGSVAPVFVFRGKGVSSGRSINTITVLPATSSPPVTPAP